MSDEMRLWIAHGLVFIGAITMATGVYGIVWMPDLYTKVHAASKAIVLGVMPLLVAVMVVGDGMMVARAVLIAVFLTITAPVSSHAIARAAYLSGELAESPGATTEPPA